MKLALTPGTTSQIVHVFIQDSTVTTGAGKTALIHSDITAYYVRAAGTLTAMTMETISTLGTWASSGDNYLGFKLMHDTNAPGLYELHLPNNILAAGANQVTIQLRATGAAPCNLEIQLIVIPANITQIGGVVQSLTDLKDFVDTGYDPSSHKVQGVVLADTATNLTNAPTVGDLTATMKASITAAVPTAVDIADAVCDETINTGHAVPNSMGKIIYDNLNAPIDAVDTVVDGLATTLGVAGAGLTALGDARLANLDAAVSSRLAPAGTLATVTNLTNAPTNGDLTTTMKASVTAAVPTVTAISTDVASKVLVSPAQKLVTDANGHVTLANGVHGGAAATIQAAITGNVTGNLSGSVSSVAGAVGSVTGDVGGNVVGSVASVTGAVGSVTGAVTVGTNNDKTGYVLTVTPPTALDIKTAIEADGSKIDHLWETTEDDAGVRRFSANALEQAPTGGSAPTVTQIRQEMDANSTQLAAIVEDTGTTLPNQITALNNLSSAGAQAAATAALNAYDPPTKAELDTAVTAIRGADDDTLKTLSDQIDGVDVDNTALTTDTANILEDLVDIKGTGFVKDSNSLVNITGSTPTNITVETTVIE